MEKKQIKIVDTTLRDGSHAVAHSFTCDQVAAVASSLDKVGVDIIELSHGDGLAGSSYNYGFSDVSEFDLLKTASANIKNAKLGVLLLPGIGTVEELKKAKECGAKVVRVATHVTEADVSIQHLKAAKELDMMTVGFLMMTHMVSPEKIVEQCKIFIDCGVDYINLADSSGYMTPNHVRERVSAIKNMTDTPVGYHAHNNLGLAVANALAAAEEGASYLDVTCRGLGAGAGNAAAEIVCAVLEREGYDTGVDTFKLMDVAQDVVEPMMHRPQTITTSALMLGYAGVYSSFLLHVERAAKRFNLNPRDILVELGKRKMVGGQEDMIIDVAYEMINKK